MKRQREEYANERQHNVKRQKLIHDTTSVACIHPYGLILDDAWEHIFDLLETDLYSTLQLSRVNRSFRLMSSKRVKDIVVRYLAKPGIELYWDQKRCKDVIPRPTQYRLYHRYQPTAIFLTEEMIKTFFDSIMKDKRKFDLPIYDDDETSHSFEIEEENENDSEHSDDEPVVSEEMEEENENDSEHSDDEPVVSEEMEDSADQEWQNQIISEHVSEPIPPFSEYEVYYYDESAYIFLRDQTMFLLLECSLSNPDQPSTMQFCSYEWHSSHMRVNVLPGYNGTNTKMVVHDNILVIYQSDVAYFFDLKSKKCRMPAFLPGSRGNLQTAVLEKKPDMLLRFIPAGKQIDELDDKSELYIIRVPSIECEHKIVRWNK